MEGLGRLSAGSGLSLAEQVQRQPSLDRPLRSDPVHRLLHLPVTTVPALHRVRRRTQELLVQEHQRFLQPRQEQLLQHLPQFDKAPQPRSQSCQLGQCRRCPASPVEQAIDLLHQTAQAAELRLVAGDPRQSLPL